MMPVRVNSPAAVVTTMVAAVVAMIITATVAKAERDNGPAIAIAIRRIIIRAIVAVIRRGYSRVRDNICGRTGSTRR